MVLKFPICKDYLIGYWFGDLDGKPLVKKNIAFLIGLIDDNVYVVAVYYEQGKIIFLMAFIKTYVTLDYLINIFNFNVLL